MIFSSFAIKMSAIHERFTVINMGIFGVSSLLVILVALESVFCTSPYCEIQVNKLTRYEPVFLTKVGTGYRLKRPVNGKITFKKAEVYFIVCTNDGELKIIQTSYQFTNPNLFLM
jgi:hypothetical protein